MPVGKYVKETIYNFGQAKGIQTVDWEFDMATEEGVEYIQTGCVCTKLSEFNEEEKKIKGTLNLEWVGIPKDESGQNFQKGIHEVRKAITVYIDDGEPENVAGELKKKIPNPNKKRETLSIVGTVEIP